MNTTFGRLTVDEAVRRGINARVEVRLNGVLTPDVIEADDESGYIVRYVRDGNGGMHLGDDHKIRTERLTGTVDIRLRDIA